MRSPLDAIRWWLDRALSIGYGVVYDYVYPRFRHYQRLQTEIRELIEAAAPAGGERRGVRVLELACGTGNLTCALAEVGFSATGLDTYPSLIEVAKEKREIRRTFLRGASLLAWARKDAEI